MSNTANHLPPLDRCRSLDRHGGHWHCRGLGLWPSSGRPLTGGPGPRAAVARQAGGRGRKNSAAPAAKADGGSLLTPQEIAAKAASDTSSSETGEERKPAGQGSRHRLDPPRHQVAQPAHVGLLCHLVRFDHRRLVCRGALPGTAAEQDPACRSGRRPAGLGQPQGRVRSPPCPAALQAISVLDGGGRAGHAGQGGASASRDRAGHDRGLRARGHAALHQRPRAEPGLQRGPHAGTGRHRARHDPLLLHHGPHAGGREQDGRRWRPAFTRP